MGGHDKIRSDEATSRCHEPADQCRHDRKGRICHDAERLAGEPQVRRISEHDDDTSLVESLSE